MSTPLRFYVCNSESFIVQTPTPTDFSCFSLLPPESLFDTLQKMYLSHLGQGQTMLKVRYTLGQLIFKQIIYKSEEMVSAQVKHGFVLKFRYKCHPWRQDMTWLDGWMFFFPQFQFLKAVIRLCFWFYMKGNRFGTRQHVDYRSPDQLCIICI